ncbi:polysaccharide deacetylase [Stutzerimonas stutzeri]|uniref:Polysaccharide deacetylase n=1 Tax=Stutzerimonas stutzeri TaxID=316 RepID=W8RC65_STUST|nr:divergent polysaccharide deacetylase family protein [Stutzerimonas stutzeri]AHL77308.1 polysaccharide deacetylase [Stutzerimonas stutzeri]MCQ4330203.1 divergent polysaccharide deacetylase family protein [Stutzerimonas stutzeri]
MSWVERHLLGALLLIGASGVEAGDTDGAERLAAVARMPKLALVIDDLGQNTVRDGRVLALPGPVAMAILPDTRHATKLAEQARTAGKTVMLHLPMAPAGGPYAWQPQLPQAELDRRLDNALTKVPHSSGVNNHMGSQMTDRQPPMAALMSELQQRHLFFLDSRTNPGTIAAAAAQQIGLASLSRDIFLDDDPSPEAVAAQFRAAIQLARKQGSVVVIGHPHPATLALLERELPKLGAQGIDWVDIGQMIATRGNRAMIAHGANGVYR